MTVVDTALLQTQFLAFTGDGRIADTTARLTVADAYDAKRRRYPPGSVRLYVSAKPTSAGADYYSFLSHRGLKFEFEAADSSGSANATNLNRPLGGGWGQAESYEEGGVTWMYTDQSYDPSPVIVATSDPVGQSFAQGTLTGITNDTVKLDANKGLLTGLSVVRLGPDSYRGYYGAESNQPPGSPVPDDPQSPIGTIFAATSPDKVLWMVDGAAGPVHGNLIGPMVSDDGTGQASNAALSGQPFALKRNDPTNPACVTLFYYRYPQGDAIPTEIYYTTALDGTSFPPENEQLLSRADVDSAVDWTPAGPTIIRLRDGTLRLYLDSECAGFRCIRAYTLRRKS